VHYRAERFFVKKACRKSPYESCLVISGHAILR
jgi:hypothetical protein